MTDTCRSPALVCLTETKLSKAIDDSEIAIQGYELCRQDINRCGGGIAIFYIIRSELTIKIVPCADTPIEHCVFRISYNGLESRVCCAYVLLVNAPKP